MLRSRNLFDAMGLLGIHISIGQVEVMNHIDVDGQVLT